MRMLSPNPRRVKRRERRPSAGHAGPMASPPVAMEPVLGKVLPAGADWRWQVKWDGIRCLAVVAADTVQLWSRRGRLITPAFPDVAASIRQALMPERGTLDGEIVVVDGAGRPSFPLALGRLLRKDASPLARYAVFDTLEAGGRDLRALPLLARLDALAASLRQADGLHRVETRVDGGAVMLHAVAELGLEGVVAKRATSPYVAGHSAHWLKFKVRRRLRAWVGGWRANASEGLRALCLVHPAADSWHYLGDAGSGLGAAQAAAWVAALRRMPPWSPPFSSPPGAAMGAAPASRHGFLHGVHGHRASARPCAGRSRRAAAGALSAHRPLAAQRRHPADGDRAGARQSPAAWLGAGRRGDDPRRPAQPSACPQKRLPHGGGVW